MRNKLERFFRGEFWLHWTTMSQIQIIIIMLMLFIQRISHIEIFNIYTIIALILLPIIIGYAKEKFDQYEGKQFSNSDMVGTVIGGQLINLIILLIQ